MTTFHKFCDAIVIVSRCRALIGAVVACASVSTVHAQAVPSEMMANDTAFKQMGIYGAWAQGYTGKGVRIGFVDTGADLTNKDMKNIILAKSPYYKTMIDVDRGHGTGVISLAAGSRDGTGVVGVAYDASVLVYAGGANGLVLYSDIANGIKWNADNKADIINLSLGARMAQTDFSKYYRTVSPGIYARNFATDPYNNTTLLPALQYAAAKGSALVFAAGNDGNLTPTSPANLAVATDTKGNLLLGGQAIIVGAVDKNNNIASFSNQAGHICQNLISNACQDKVFIRDFFVVAPGGSLQWVANANSTVTKTSAALQDIGTSDSAAYVSGVLALLRSSQKQLTAAQSIEILKKSAVDLGTPGVDSVYGYGLVSAERAINMAIGQINIVKATTQTTTQISASNAVLSSTGMTGGVITKQSFMGSNALQNTQVVDSTGRTFSANMTAGIATTMMAYNPGTAYSALSGGAPINYVDFGYGNALSSVYSSATMNGAKVGHQFDSKVYVGMEVGVAHEINSVLGSTGYGGMAVGNSDTHWNAFHLGLPVANESMLFGSMAVGSTKAGIAPDSLITGFSTLKTKSWTMGFMTKNVFANRDSLTFQVTEMPHITSGTAEVTSVTGFNYDNVTDMGANVTPTVTRETLNLVNSYRQFASSVIHTMPLDKVSLIKTSLLFQSDNAGSKVNQMLSINYIARF